MAEMPPFSVIPRRAKSKAIYNGMTEISYVVTCDVVLNT